MFGLFQLARQFAVVILQLVLLALQLVDLSLRLVQFGVQVVELVLQLLVDLVGGRLALGDVLDLCVKVIDLGLQLGALLLNPAIKCT